MITDKRNESDMSVAIVVTAFPAPDTAPRWSRPSRWRSPRVHDEPGVELYALPEGPDRLVMIEEYESEQTRSEHAEGPALAALRSALGGKLSSGLDAQVPRTAPGRKRAEGRPVTTRR